MDALISMVANRIMMGYPAWSQYCCYTDKLKEDR
jgi:hypothetical protein